MRAHPLTKVRYSFLRILTGSDLSRRRLPLMTAICSQPGPVVWLTACGHGDEVGGIVIIQEVFRKIKRKLVRGSVYAFPMMNPIGFETTSRHITISKEDLNRSFPGSRDGTLGERIADIIFSTILDTSPSLLLDLHNDWIRSIPYTLLDVRTGALQEGMNKKLTALSRHTGFLIIRDSEEIRNSLSSSLIRRGIPAMTLELGEPYVVNEQNIQYGVRSVWNILSHLGMIEPSLEQFVYPLPENCPKGKVLTYSDRPYSSSSGIIRFLTEPGAAVRKGHALAKIYNAFGKLQETITAENDGIVLGHADYSVVFPGMPMMAFGIL